MNKKFLALSFGMLTIVNTKIALAYDCTRLEEYSQTSTYYAGNTVQHTGNAFECLVGGWCTIGGAFAPGTGWATNHAWKNLGKCDDPVDTNIVPVIDNHGPYAALPGEAISFDGESIARDPDGTIEKYEWNFGNEVVSNEVNPIRIYEGLGLHPFTFTVTDDDGASTTSNSSVTVSLEPNSECPARRWFKDEAYIIGEVVQNGGLDYRCTNGACAYPSASPEPGGIREWKHIWDLLGDCTLNNDYNILPRASVKGPNKAKTGEEIQFDSSASSDPDGTIISYEWDFGDGNSSTEQNPSHIYTIDGRFNVKLVVTDNDGGTHFGGTLVTVTRPNNPDCWAPIWFSGMTIEKYDVVQHNGRDYRCLIDVYCGVFGIEPGVPGTLSIFEDMGVCSLDPPPPPTKTCAELTPNFENGAEYNVGDLVDHLNRKFRCDVVGWCSTGGWAYTPGSGTHWEMAWTDLGECL